MTGRWGARVRAATCTTLSRVLVVMMAMRGAAAALMVTITALEVEVGVGWPVMLLPNAASPLNSDDLPQPMSTRKKISQSPTPRNWPL